jgi:hypothetical protein
MAGRTSFNKRQKERSRQDKQREKTEKKVQKRLENSAIGPKDPDSLVDFSAFQSQMALPGEQSGEEE